MSMFFVPGTGEDTELAERAWDEMRLQLELELGTAPKIRRIAKLWTRRGSTDCVTEVGLPDPVHGGIVLAIFDMGRQQPFVVWWRPDGGPPSGIREILSHHAYSVVDFDS